MSFKTQLLTRPITAGYNWINTLFLIFIGHYLTKICNKFDLTLLDSTRSNQFGRKRKNVNVCFLFMIHFKSLYTLSKIKKVSYSERKNLARSKSTASRTQRSTRVKKLQRLSLFQQMVVDRLCKRFLIQKEKKLASPE